MLTDEHLENQITDEELAFFNAEGYLIIKNVLNSEHIKKLEKRIDAIHQDLLDQNYDPYTQRALGPNDNLFYPNFIGEDRLFLNLIDHPKTFPKVWGILGHNIYSYHSHFIITPKEDSIPEEPRPLGFHQDSGRVNLEMEGDPRPRLSLKVAYWLSDMSQPGRGNFYIVPGSHLQNAFHNPKDGTLPEGAIPFCANAGDAVLFDRRLFHSRSPNPSDITRKCLFFGYSYRWIRSKDALVIPEKFMAESDPVRKQLLGYSPEANNLFHGNCPLRFWMDEKGIKWK